MRPIPLVLLLACGPKVAPPPAAAPPSSPLLSLEADGPLDPDAIAGVADPRLQVLLDRHWTQLMSEAPTWATSLGDRRFDDRLGDRSPEGTWRRRAAREALIATAETIDPASLAEADRLTLALLLQELRDDAAADVCAFERWAVSPRSNPAVDYNDLADVHPLDTEADGEALLARYGQLARVTREELAQLRLGLAEGRVANAATVRLVIAQLDEQLAADPSTWALAAVTRAERAEWTDAARARFDEAALAHLSGEYRAALGEYRDFLRDALLPAARGPEAVGLAAMPDGAACYAARVRAFTTLERDAAAVHQLGREEMAAIHEEIREVGQRVFGTDDLQAIFTRLRTEPSLYFTTEAEVEAKAVDAVAAARAAIPRAFGRLPQAEVVVRPVPENEAPYTTIAYYRNPAADGSRPGIYYVNTYAPETRPRHEAEVLAFHEAIPGHHLQIAIAQELPELPAFRRHLGMTAFVEGWALYTERLADELGLYTADVDRLGMLSFDTWRAARLVVDTGIHAQGWTREQAEAYMLENTPLAPNNIANEVDRYISWPGQALAYKTGQLHLRALRAQAEAELGERFDLRAFHDVVLGGGAVPLPVLTERVDAWIAAERAR